MEQGQPDTARAAPRGVMGPPLRPAKIEQPGGTQPPLLKTEKRPSSSLSPDSEPPAESQKRLKGSHGPGDGAAEEQPAQPGSQQGHVMSMLLAGLKLGQSTAAARHGGALSSISDGSTDSRLFQPRQPWASPFTDAETLEAHLEEDEEELETEPEKESKYIEEWKLSEVEKSEFRDEAEQYRRRLPKVEAASKRVMAAVGTRNDLVFHVPSISMGAQTGTSKSGGTIGDNHTLMERLTFWAGATGRMERVGCRILAFDLVDQAVGIGPAKTESSSSLGPLRPSDMTLKYLHFQQGGLMRMYKGDVPDESGRLHRWTWFEIVRPLIIFRPDKSLMPPEMTPMPQSTLVLAFPDESAQQLVHQGSQLRMKLSEKGIPSLQSTHEPTVVEGIPEKCLCITAMPDDIDAYPLTPEKAQHADWLNDGTGGKGGGDGLATRRRSQKWDSWWSVLKSRCRADARGWEEVLEGMAVGRIELKVQKGGEPWMRYDGKEWKLATTRGPSVQKSLGRGPASEGLLQPGVSLPSRQRSKPRKPSGLRDESSVG